MKVTTSKTKWFILTTYRKILSIYNIAFFPASTYLSSKAWYTIYLRLEVQCNGPDHVVLNQDRCFYQQLTKGSERVDLIKVTHLEGLWAREQQITITMSSLQNYDLVTLPFSRPSRIRLT